MASSPVTSESQPKIDIVREAFVEVLNVEHASISCKSTFSELGGSLLLALKVKDLLHRMKLDVVLGQLLGLETVERITVVF